LRVDPLRSHQFSSAAVHAGALKKVIQSDLKRSLSFSFSGPLPGWQGAFVLRSPATTSTNRTIMGDKSPKSQNKNKKQKQSKTDASNQKKARDTANKQGGPSGMKGK
jgi:hypothetical protein